LDLLRQNQITVVLNVKRSVLERIALFTGTQLIQSPEMILTSTQVGRCGRFRLQEFRLLSSGETNDDKSESVTGRNCYAKKSLMFLEGCRETIGCSVILRGSARFAEFRKLKGILRYMIYVHYHCRLEKSF